MLDILDPDNNKKKISVILPTYNESENIGLMIDEIISILDTRDFEIIVVDDDSPDMTWKIVEDIGSRDKRIRFLKRVNKRGLTSALNDGINMAVGDIVVWMDCDFQMPPSTILSLLKPIDEKQYDAVIGSRFIKGGKDQRYNRKLNQDNIVIIHKLLSKIICRFTSIIFRSSFTDWTSGFIAIKRDIFDKITLRGDYGEYFMYLIHYLLSKGYKVIEVPYILSPRKRGQSKTSSSSTGFIKKGIKYLISVIRIALFKGSDLEDK